MSLLTIVHTKKLLVSRQPFFVLFSLWLAKLVSVRFSTVVFTAWPKLLRDDFLVRKSLPTDFQIMETRDQSCPRPSTCLFKPCWVYKPPNGWRLSEGVPVLQTALRRSSLDLKALSLIICQYLSWGYDNIKWQVNPNSSLLAYQIISEGFLSAVSIHYFILLSQNFAMKHKGA